MDKARISKLRLESYVRSARYSLDMRYLLSPIEEFSLDLLDARRRIAELEKDAERYRAIREGKWAIRQGQTIVQIDAGNYAYPLGTGGDLDSAVDAAIAAQRQKEGE
jgi:hypothetical protein